MPRDGSVTRERILERAQELVLDQGFAATSVDAVIAGAGVAKGAFFHHFPSKAALARSLVERWAEAEAEHYDAFMARAERLATDPLQQLLVFVGLWEEAAEGMTMSEQGCLFASFVYERGLMDAETRAVVAGGIARWRELLSAKLRQVAEAHPPRREVDLESLADELVVLFEGAFVVARALGAPTTPPRQHAPTTARTSSSSSPPRRPRTDGVRRMPEARARAPLAAGRYETGTRSTKA
ncbi:MAG: TetR family transcriptional regulator [Thermoleophilia bacterium]